MLTRYRQQLPPSLPPGLQHFDYLPFRQLLPHATAFISHGGIGTIAQGLAAGVPQLLMPMSHDQPDNARRLQLLGAGSWLSPRDSPDVLARCRELARRVDFSQALAASACLIEAASARPAA